MATEGKREAPTPQPNHPLPLPRAAFPPLDGYDGLPTEGKREAPAPQPKHPLPLPRAACPPLDGYDGMPTEGKREAPAPQPKHPLPLPRAVFPFPATGRDGSLYYPLLLRAVPRWGLARRASAL